MSNLPNLPHFRIFAILLAVSSVVPAFASPSTVLRDRGEFDSRSLLGGRESSLSGLSFANPSRFSMQQSYSVSAYSSGSGSMSSGLYLNTVSYRISDPLVLSVDMGVHTPMHSTFAGNSGATGAEASSFVLPRIGLDYVPNDRFSMHFQVYNGPDAWKAYGPYPFFPGSRIP
jgi:hypothetical protein